MSFALLVSCEHASNSLPGELVPLFSSAADMLAGHRGYDIGASGIACALASEFNAHLFTGSVSRLVVDLNRSPGNRSLFSKYTMNLLPEEKQALLETYYFPYRSAVEREVALMSGREKVIHVSVHSFTPVLDGVKRECDIGLLYDPSRASEKKICREWKNLLVAGGYRVRLNYPYRGISDGITSWLRRKYPDELYSGIELEISQEILTGKQEDVKKLEYSLVSMLRTVCI